MPPTTTKKPLDTTAIVIALITVLGSFAGAWLTANQRAAVVAASTATVTAQVETEKALLEFKSGKICSAFVPNQFRDSILVPASWTAQTCEAFRQAVGGYDYQLGCVTEGSFSFGAANSKSPPSPNCGW